MNWESSSQPSLVNIGDNIYVLRNVTSFHKNNDFNIDVNTIDNEHSVKFSSKEERDRVWAALCQQLGLGA